jgi:hypothetical protein
VTAGVLVVAAGVGLRAPETLNKQPEPQRS